LTLHKDLVKVATMPMHIGSPPPGTLIQWDVTTLAEEAWQADMDVLQLEIQQAMEEDLLDTPYGNMKYAAGPRAVPQSDKCKVRYHGCGLGANLCMVGPVVAGEIGRARATGSILAMMRS